MDIVQRIDAVLAEMGAASSKLDAATRRKINAALSKGVTSGYPYAKTFGAGLNAALGVLSRHGIEPTQIVSPPLSNEGRVTIPLAFTNPADSFSPIEITNSDLVVSFTTMDKGVEIVAYVT